MSWLLTILPGRLLAELAIFGVLLGSSIFLWDRWQEERVSLIEYKATVAAQGLAQAQRVKDREQAQEAANARTLADLQTSLDAASRRSTDLAGRLRQALGKSCPVPKAQGQPPATDPTGASGQGRLSELLGGRLAECERNELRFWALQAELAGQ